MRIVDTVGVKVAPGEVESLSSAQVALLLKTLRRHEHLLNSSQQDATRLIRTGLKPAYVVDFEMLHRYMYSLDENPQWVVELEYLFSQHGENYIIGPGTLIEIQRHIHRLTALSAELISTTAPRWVDPAEAAQFDLLVNDIRAALRTLSGRSTDLAAFDRLYNLLLRGNFVHYSAVTAQVSCADPDPRSLELMSSLLEKLRPGRVQANLADALNYASTVTLRNAAQRGELEFFPYLLTETRALVSDDVFQAGPYPELDISSEVTRSPASAIYSHKLFEQFSDPAEAVDHTAQMLVDVATRRQQLTRMPAYHRRIEDLPEWQWEQVVEERRLSDSFSTSLADLAELTKDPVFAEAQGIYDIAELASKSWRQQRGESVERFSSVGRLFDLLVQISRILDDTHHSGVSVSTLWGLAVAREEEVYDQFKSLRYAESGSTNRSYLTVEVHPPEGPNTSHVVVRWPSSSDLARILTSFSGAFLRQKCTVVELTLGTSRGAFAVEADLPVLPSDLTSALEGARLLWLRMGAPKTFEVFADIASSPMWPRVGVVGRQLDIEHVADLYALTGSRFVFHSWLRGMLTEALPVENREQ